MKKFVVISHTHWDREWYMPFEAFRLKLVDLIDKLLVILEGNPDYIFHLDAQTVVLEDYLEIRPAREKTLKDWITKGNIVVGPWYLQNDFYLTSGESTVRNLLRGGRIAREFGRCTQVGYAPDQFGNVSQLPQILAGFGIDNFIFGRGYGFYEREGENVVRREMPTEFLWEGADGTRCLAVFLRQWYNNAQHIPADPEMAELLLDINEKGFFNITPYVLLMNGVDHLEAQGDVCEIVETLRARGRDIKQYRMDDYVQEVKDWISAHDLAPAVYRGALLHGNDWELLRGCWASRIHLKQDNVGMQTMLEDKLEPLYALLENGGLTNCYPADHMTYLWKNLMKNHPHDSICGCSRDEVHAHMEDNFQKLREMSEELLRRGLKLAARHTKLSVQGEENYLLTVFNPTEEKLSDVVEADLQFLRAEDVKTFRIVDAAGEEVPYVVLGAEDAYYDVFSGVNLPGILETRKVKVLVACKDVPAMAVENLVILPNEQPQPLVRAKSGIENEFYRIEATGGRIDILCKKSGVTVRDAVAFEDAGDRGESYVFVPVDEAPLFTDPDRAVVKVTEDNALRKVLRVEYTLKLPKQYDFDKQRRSPSTMLEPVAFELVLKKNCDVVELRYEIENRAEDHRLRLVVDSAIAADAVVTDSAFDCAPQTDADVCVSAMSRTFCNATFAAVQGEGRGFALLTQGQHEVERVGSKLYLTLLRATGTISRGSLGPQWQSPAGQLKRRLAGRVGLYGYGAESLGQVFTRAKAFRTGLVSYFTSADAKKFAGGRFAVQDAKLAQLYYAPDPYPGVALETRSAVRYGNTNIVLSAFKGAEDGDGVIVRLVNYADTPQRTKLCVRGGIYATNLAETEARKLGADAVEVEFGPKQIRTFRVRAEEAGE